MVSHHTPLDRLLKAFDGPAGELVGWRIVGPARSGKTSRVYSGRMTARFARLKSRATLVHLSLGALLACGTFGVRAQEQPQVVITLERTMCYGTCPAYTLRITGDGSVEYEGMRYVRV